MLQNSCYKCTHDISIYYTTKTKYIKKFHIAAPARMGAPDTLVYIKARWNQAIWGVHVAKITFYRSISIVWLLHYILDTSSVEWAASKKLLLKYMLPDTSLSKYIRTDGTTVDKTKEASNEIVLRLPVALGYYNLSFYNFFTCSESCSTAHPRIELTEPIEYFFNRKECRSTT